jgi:hypothetical protein
MCGPNFAIFDCVRMAVMTPQGAFIRYVRSLGRPVVVVLEVLAFCSLVLLVWCFTPLQVSSLLVAFGAPRMHAYDAYAR